MSSAGRVLMALIALTLALLAASPALADGPAGGGSEALLEGLPPTGKPSGSESVVLAARLLDADRQPEAGRRVSFYVVNDVFGERLMRVGEAITDATGVALLPYQPSWEGEHKVVVRFAGGEGQAPVQTTYDFDVTGPVPLHENAPFGLEPVRAWLPFFVGAVVLAVWAVLGIVAVRVVFGMETAGAAAEPVQIHAPAQAHAPEPFLPKPVARGLIVAVALLILAAPMAFLVQQQRGGDHPSLSLQGGGGGARPTAVPGQSNDGPQPVDTGYRPFSAELVRSVPLVTTDRNGSITSDSADLPADIALIEGRAFVLDTNNGRILAVIDGSKSTPMFESQRGESAWIGGSVAMASQRDTLYVAGVAGGNVVIVPPGGDEEVVAPQLPASEQPLRPTGIAVTEWEDFWLSDSDNHRVLQLSPRGELLKIIGDGAESAGEYGFNSPGGLHLDERGNLFVADTLNHVVKKYSPLGVYLMTIGKHRLAEPVAVTTGEDGTVFVSDAEQQSVVAFSPDGGYLGSIGGKGATDAGSWLQAPYGLEVDGDSLYVMDRLFGLLVFELAGRNGS